MCKLIESSGITLEWLKTIRSAVEKKIPDVVFNESKYWAQFKSTETNRNFVQLHPQKGQIRLYTVLDPNTDESLQVRPEKAQSDWKNSFPSFFVVDEGSIDKAIDLIIKSYEEDLQK